MINLIAREQFAAANGWKIGKSFGLDQLIRKKKNTGSSNRLYTMNMFSGAADHPEHFRRDGYPMALLGHNYPGNRGHYIDGVRDLVAGYVGQLVLHIPPAGNAASWYCPGGMLPMLLTRPDITEIVWPTDEQMAAMAAAYADEVKRRSTMKHAENYLRACARNACDGRA
jgi:hypothetical protein